MNNLIGNCCISSWITSKNLKQEFINPFTWCIMNFESSYNLIKYWDSLDFRNYELIKDENWNFSIIIDNKVKVQYVHYKFSPKYNKPTKIGDDIFYNKIWEYIVEKYETRLNKMLELKIKPIFILAQAKNSPLKRSYITIEQQEKIKKLNSNYKIVLSFDKMIEPNGNIFCANQTKKYDGNTWQMANEIFNKIKTTIL